MVMKDGEYLPTGWDEVVNIQGCLTSMALDRLLGTMPKHREA